MRERTGCNNDDNKGEEEAQLAHLSDVCHERDPSLSARAQPGATRREVPAPQNAGLVLPEVAGFGRPAHPAGGGGEGAAAQWWRQPPTPTSACRRDPVQHPHCQALACLVSSSSRLKSTNSERSGACSCSQIKYATHILEWVSSKQQCLQTTYTTSTVRHRALSSRDTGGAATMRGFRRISWGGKFGYKVE